MANGEYSPNLVTLAADSQIFQTFLDLVESLADKLGPLDNSMPTTNRLCSKKMIFA
jgi:hypothetical protein